MQTMFKSLEWWDIIENGYEEPTEPPVVLDQKLREN